MKITENINNVDVINGEGTEEVAGFSPTRHELLQIAKYWERKYLELSYFFFWTGQFCYHDSLISLFAQQRLQRISEVLGASEFNKAIQDARDEFRAKGDLRTWDAFTNGDRSLMLAIQEETFRHEPGRCACARVDDRVAHEIDWKWIEQEAELHRNDKCSVGE